MRPKKILVGLLAIAAVGVLIVSSPEFEVLPQSATGASVRLPVMHGSPPSAPMKNEFPPLSGAGEWLNSPPLSPADLRGKVVLVDFWTFTCINWLRTLPYVRAWAAKYKDQGLVVIGVHSPEFAFEENVDNVRKAAKARGVTYPIAIDNDRAIWSGFGNHYWPALYFIDAAGRVRDHHFGEGNYGASETRIRELLSASGTGGGIDRESLSVEAAGPEIDADWGSLKSPETYIGHHKAEKFVSPGGAAVNMRR